MIHAATHVIEKGGSEWKKFASIVLPPPPTHAEPNPATARPNTPSISAPPANSVQGTSQQRRKGKALSRRELIGFSAVAGAVLLWLILHPDDSGAGKSGDALGSNRETPNASERKPAAQKITGNKTPRSTEIRWALRAPVSILLDRDAVLRLVEVRDKRGSTEEETNAALKQLRIGQESEGRRYTLERNCVVRKQGDAVGGFVEVLAENQEGLKKPRFWVHVTNLENEYGLVGSKILTGYTVFRGDTGTEVEEADVLTLLDLIVGVYQGKISSQAAAKCVFRPEAQGREEMEIQTVIGSYVIYEGRDSASLSLAKFAMKRSTGNSDPLGSGAVRFVGRENFTTSGGVVVSVPVVALVNETK